MLAIPLSRGQSVAGAASSFAVRYACAWAGALYNLSVGVATPRGRGWIAHTAEPLTGTRSPVPKLPRIAPDAITNDHTPVVVREIDARPGNVSYLELVVLDRLVREHHPALLFEIGTFDGRTAVNLAANAGPHATVRTLDLPPDPTPALPTEYSDRQFMRDDLSGCRIVGSDVEQKIERLRGDSATFDFTRCSAQFVFVDGAHSFNYVLHDARAAMTLLHGGHGVIAFHDYGSWPGVTRALDLLWQTDPAFQAMRWVEGTMLAVLIR